MSSVIDNDDTIKQRAVATGALYRKNILKTNEVKDFVCNTRKYNNES